MRCIVCEALSLRAICTACQEEFLVPKIQVRLIENIKVYSFYSFDSLQFLLSSKYYSIGSRIYAIMAKRAMLYFKNHPPSHINKTTYAVGIDSPLYNTYSHTAIILHAFRKIFIPIYGELRAQNKVKYAGKSLEFRRNNPRGLIYKSGNINCVVMDDVITTGTSMLEARDVITKGGGNFLYGITLCDAAI